MPEGLRHLDAPIILWLASLLALALVGLYLLISDWWRGRRK